MFPNTLLKSFLRLSRTARAPRLVVEKESQKPHPVPQKSRGQGWGTLFTLSFS